MKLRSIKRHFAMFCINHLFSGTRFFGIKRNLMNFAGYKVGENTKIVGPIFCTGSLEIGKNCWVGRDLTVNGNGKVKIGDNCDIAPSVMFLTGGHEIGTEERRAGKGENYTISIENGAWVGARTTILGNVKIGSGSVAAACACVVSDIPENILFGGVPAKKIRELEK